jgi:hypothetical protein
MFALTRQRLKTFIAEMAEVSRRNGERIGKRKNLSGIDDSGRLKTCESQNIGT